MLPGCRRLWAVAAGSAVASLLVLELVMAETPVISMPLSRAEKDWLARHPELVLAPQPEFYPFEFFDKNGNYRGVAADYIALIEKRLGIKFKIARIEGRRQRMAAIKSRDVDVIAATESTSSELTQYMSLTSPHIVMPGTIISDKEYKNLDALKGRKVAVVSGDKWEAILNRNYPDISMLRVPDIVTGLELTSFRAVDALVGDMATTSYYIHREGMTDLRVVGVLQQNLELGIATRKDWPELNGILRKALASITEKEKEKISRQWIHRKSPSIFQNDAFWFAVLATVAVIFLVLAIIIFWNQALKKQVAQRTRALKQELQHRHKAEIELQTVHENLIQSHNELKETQLQLIRAEKLESVGRLAAGIAHEVKNPLSVIRMGLDYVSSEFDAKNKHGEVLRDMDKAVRRADSVINSLLDFSRVSKLQLATCDLNRIINESLILVNHELTQRNIKLAREFDKNLSPIEADANKLQQVFVNLFINAIQAMQNGGTLGVATYFRDVRRQGASGNVSPTSEKIIVAEVTDTGPGVTDDMLEKIFDPFYTTKPVGKGTGLGLSVAKNIMDMHNAGIDIRNRETGGLSVILEFSAETGG